MNDKSIPKVIEVKNEIGFIELLKKSYFQKINLLHTYYIKFLFKL